MGIPQTTVEIEFSLSSATGNIFTLNDATKGALNNTTYTLGGLRYVDVTSYVRAVQINRGKQQDLDKYNAGTCTIVLNNKTAIFDPTIPSGTVGYPYAGQIKPKRRVRVTTGGQIQFVGYIQDWDYEYPIDDNCTATVKAADVLTNLANNTFTSQTFSSSLSGTMVDAILSCSDVAFPTGVEYRSISAGYTTMQAISVNNQNNVLDTLQLIEASEPSDLFVSKEGVLTFTSRRSTTGFTTTIQFADDGGATSIPFRALQVDFGSELLYTKAVVQRQGGAAQTSTNSAGVTDYGILVYQESSLLMTTDEAALSKAQFISNTYGSPTFRVSEIETTLGAMSGAQAGLMLGLDIADSIRVKFTPPNGLQQNKVMTIVGKSHAITPAEHIVTFNMVEGLETGLIVGDAAIPSSSQPYSTLDNNFVGF